MTRLLSAHRKLSMVTTLPYPFLLHVPQHVLSQVRPEHGRFNASLADARPEIEPTFEILEGCMPFQALHFTQQSGCNLPRVSCSTNMLRSCHIKSSLDVHTVDAHKCCFASVSYSIPPVFLPLPMLLQQPRHHHLMMLTADALDSSHAHPLQFPHVLFSFSSRASSLVAYHFHIADISSIAL